MSRTFRNRHTIPKGWVVRDDGNPYLDGHDRYGRKAIEEYERKIQYHNKYFSHLYTPQVPKYRRSLYRCEVGWIRTIWYRKYRRRSNLQVRNWQWDEILPPTRTSGWLTW